MPKKLEGKQEVELTEEEKQKEWDDVPAGGNPAEPKGEIEPEGDKPKPEDVVAGEVDGKIPPVEEPPANPPADEPQYREVVHQGQIHRITEEKYLELAQKGFDYESKVAKIAPQRRLVELVEQYPEVAQMVDDHVRAKLAGDNKPKVEKQGFEIKPLSEYGTADEWLQDNIAVYSAATQQANTPKAQTQEDVNAQIIMQLKMHDPQGFATVFPALKEAMNHVTVAEYQKIDSDLAEFLNFYDTVKANMQAKQQTNPPPTPRTPGKPPFKMPSGKLSQKANINSAEKIWELPNTKFDETINKARGFA